jgi:hypothetical protein
MAPSARARHAWPFDPISRTELAMLRHALSLALLVASAAAAHGQGLVNGGPRAGRVLWLRADQGVKRGLSDLVTDWRDMSVGSSHVDLNNTTLVALPEWRAAEVNGRPALHFDGNDWLYGVGMPTGSYTKVAVCQLDGYAPTNNVFSGTTWHALYFGGSDRARIFHGGDFVTSDTGVQLATPVVLVATYDATTGDGVLYQDTVKVGSGNDGKVGNSDSTFLLGAFGFANFFTGSIAEVMAYDHVLSTADLADLHRYLQQRYHADPAPVVHLDVLPKPGQILQRDDTDSAPVTIAGTVQSFQWTAVSLEIMRDGVPFDSSQQNLTFTGGSAPFTFTRTLLAGKNDYALSLYAWRGVERRLIAQIGDVAVGDVWLINGQSNAVAADYYGEHMANPECQNRWVRSFGTATTGYDAPFDLHWDLADGESIYWHGSVGSWGLRIGALLENRYDLPIGLINGAVGGTSITQHQRNNANPEDLATIYGRMLYRVEASGAQKVARGMLWYQGESDGDLDGLWLSNWHTLRQAWKLDFPAMKSIYLFQIRDNCAGGGRPIREAQRELIDNSINTYVMSTTAAPLHDGCHYQYLGYRELGDRMERILARDFYGSNDTQEIDPPNIQTATWNDAAHTQILLTMRDPDDRLVVDPGAEANFYTDTADTIVSATVNGNTVLLQLGGASSATLVNYDGHPKDGPWFKNARNVGALTFFGVPIQ